ncbi:MAG: GAF domain-containing protein [Candidatus Eremiobacteraeota bacterium]|nr:GAF domain-containing protein [Candidatus Eremiobacteraeota bacterium]
MSQLETSTLRLLLDVGAFFNSSLDFQDVLNNVMDKVIEVLQAERGCIFLREEGMQFAQAVARGMNHETIEADDFSVSRNQVLQVLETGEPILSDNAMKDARFNSFQSVSLHNIRSIMAVPITFKGEVRGLIYVDNRIQAGIFKPAQLELLTLIAQQAAGAIENARLYKTRKEIILVLANAIEAKDAYTRGHIERVCGYSMAIGRELGLPDEDLHDLEISSFLHDAGKIGVPDAVLQKPGQLDDVERKEMEKHALLGEALVLPIDIPRRVKLSIRQHQERFDGKGYPDGLSGEDIYIFARIIAVADTWDAMTSDRVYRKALAREEAIKRLSEAAGSQLDPTVVKAFLQVVERGEEHLRYSVAERP